METGNHGNVGESVAQLHYVDDDDDNLSEFYCFVFSFMQWLPVIGFIPVASRFDK